MKKATGLLLGVLVLGALAAQAQMLVCFAPDQDCSVPLISAMTQSHRTLDIAIYDLNMKDIANTIIAAFSKKIKIRVVVDREQSKTKTSLVDLLVKAGVSVKYGKQKGIMHDKFTVVDGRWVETGSYNYTGRATVDNHENQIYTNDPDVVEAYETEFEKLWAAGVPIE